MNLHDHDGALRDAQAELDRKQTLFDDTRTRLDDLRLQIHHAPAKNEALLVARAQAELDGLPAPEGDLIDVDVLKRQADELEKRLSVFTDGRNAAIRALSEVRTDRARVSRRLCATRKGHFAAGRFAAGGASKPFGFWGRDVASDLGGVHAGIRGPSKSPPEGLC